MSDGKIRREQRYERAVPALVAIVFIALGAGGCAEEQDQGKPASEGRMSGTCSQMNRAISRWQGRETLDCGPDLTASIELAALGRGSLLARHRFSPPDERFQMGPDGTFTSVGQPRVAPEWLRFGFTLLPPYGDADAQPIVLIYDTHSAQWSLAVPGLDGLRLVQTGAWTTRPETQVPWSEATPGGRQLIGIGGDLVLDRNLGDGSTRLWRFVRQPDKSLFQLDPMLNFAGGPRVAFRRGHRVVPLGPGRLLEWQPVPCDGAAGDDASCARYAIWNYSLDETETKRDPFPSEPTATGSWTDVGAGDDLVADEAHIYVWTRATGGLRAYALDPSATNPLTPSLKVRETQRFETLRAMDWQPPTRAPEIKHLVVILQDGRSFDSYFGKYCAPGSPGGDKAISCVDGPECCEGLPEGPAAACVPLDPNADSSRRPNSDPGCMRVKMNDGAMDRFAHTDVDRCGDAEDLSCAGVGDAAGSMNAYHQLATRGALADRFFQTYAFVQGDGENGKRPFLIADPATENFLYLTTTRFGEPFWFPATPLVDDELSRQETTWAIYAGRKNLGQIRFFGAPQFHDPDWYPYRDLEGGEFENDLASRELPSVSVVLPDATDVERSEAPGHRIDRSIAFTTGLIETIEQSPVYRGNTLILLAYLTAGGYYDHVRSPPPPPLDVDATPDGQLAIHYGPRVPLLALGRFARTNRVSHVPMEMSSIATFIEWNWLFGRPVKHTGQRNDPRQYRDTWTNNIGSLLDPTLHVPESRR